MPLLKEPFRVVKDCDNWDFHKPLNDQPWREAIKMKGTKLGASGQYVFYYPKLQLKCYRYQIVQTGWELAAWACEERAVSMGLASTPGGQPVILGRCHPDEAGRSLSADGVRT
jgi:hypothetical protein